MVKAARARGDRRDVKQRTAFQSLSRERFRDRAAWFKDQSRAATEDWQREAYRERQLQTEFLGARLALLDEQDKIDSLIDREGLRELGEKRAKAVIVAEAMADLAGDLGMVEEARSNPDKYWEHQDDDIKFTFLDRAGKSRQLWDQAAEKIGWSSRERPIINTVMDIQKRVDVSTDSQYTYLAEELSSASSNADRLEAASKLMLALAEHAETVAYTHYDERLDDRFKADDDPEDLSKEELIKLAEVNETIYQLQRLIDRLAADQGKTRVA